MELAVHDLVCRRAGRLVFSGLNFNLGAGDSAVLRGPNGSGKSSLLRMLAGLTPVAGGEAVLDGVSLTAERETFQEKIAYAGHLDAVKPAFTVRRNITSWAEIYGADPAAAGAKADAALARFGLGHIADYPAIYCSAGQKRRLGLARMLVIGRPVWLLDEPTVSLDVQSTADFAGMVREHCAGGGVALAATHMDLGFGEGQVIDMRDVRPEARDAASDGMGTADPFMQGDWG